METIRFASAHVKRLSADATLPAKFQRLLGQYDLPARFGNRTVAIKMHFGGNLGYTTIHPLFVQLLVKAIQDAGGRPFCVDGSFSVGAARARGYTAEVLGCPIVGAGGVADKYVYEVPAHYDSLDVIKLMGNIVDADAMVVLSHGKGHGHTSFGAAIKNIAMGCVACETRGKIHGLMAGHFDWQSEACTHCRQCVENCPTKAASFDAQDRLTISEHHCRYCMHCVEACPAACLQVDGSRYRAFQHGMALAVKACLDRFEADRVLYLTCLLNITPLCDCWGFSLPAVVPDIGILAGDNVVAIEQAALDLIDADNYIPGSLPDQMTMGAEGHLFQRIHNKDPYVQVEACADMGLGSREYHRVEVE